MKCSFSCTSAHWIKLRDAQHFKYHSESSTVIPYSNYYYYYFAWKFFFFYMNLFVKKKQLHSYSLGCGRKVIKDKTAKSNVELPAVVTSCGKEAAESSHNS